MDSEILEKLRELKEIYKKDGFIIEAIFGSYARGDYTKESDVDILYYLNEDFYKKYVGFSGFKKLEDIKSFISQTLHKKVDLAPKTNLSKTGKKYILKDLVYV